MTGQERAALIEAAAAAQAAEDAIREGIEAARAAGTPWSTIAGLLGCPEATARQRYGGEVTTGAAAADLGVSAAVLRSAAARAVRGGASPADLGCTPATDGRSASWHLPTLRAWWATRPPKGWPRRKDTT